MEPGGPEAGLRAFEDAVAELSQELGRLAQNLQALTRYQATLLSVNRSLCSWMENINELSKHRKRLPTCAALGK